MKKRLLAVQGPVQYVSGYISMEWFAQTTHADEECETVLLVYDLLMPSDIEHELVDIINRLASAQNWRSVLFITRAQMTEIMRGNYEACKQKLRDCIGEPVFDEIFLARDYCGDGSPLIINAYPSAKRIVYGDALGLVGDERDLVSFNWKTPVRSFLSRCKRSLKEKFNGGPERSSFDVAVLILPQDMYGEYLPTVPLLIPEKYFVVANFEAACRPLDDLSQYCRDLIGPGVTVKDHVFLLSNLSASGLMSFENEIAMYIETIRTTATRGSRIFLKAHPRGAHEILGAVIEGLKNEFKIIPINDPRFSRFPIELWAVLIKNCTIVPIFSTSAMNIEYVYDIKVKLPLTDAAIRKFFYKDRMAEVINSHTAIVQSVERLQDWDGATVLWMGN